MRRLVWLPLLVLLSGLVAAPAGCEGDDAQDGAGGDLPDGSPGLDGGADADGGPLPSVTCEPGPGQRYYVSPTGDDAAGGTEQAPWRTLARAADGAEPGDTVYLLAGIWGERLVPPRSGAEDTPITFMAAPNNASAAVLDGTGVDVGTGGLVQVQGVSFIQICGLTVRNSAADGVRIDQIYDPVTYAEHILVAGLTVERSGETAIKAHGAHFVVIDGNHTRGSVSSGVGVWSSSDVVVSHNEVVNARDDEALGHEESISIASTEGFDVFDNEIYLDGNVGFLGNEGIDVKESSRNGRVHHNFVHDFPETGGAIYVDAWTAGLDGTPTLSTVDVTANLLLRAGGIAVGSEQGGTVEHLRIFNNIVVGVSWAGIILSDTGHGSGGDGPRHDIQIWNNTVFDCIGNGGAGIYIVTTNIQDVVIQNNLIAFGDNWNGQITAATSDSLAELTVDHNLVFGTKHCSQDYPSCVELSDWPDNDTADPLLADPDGLDFHLLPGSPAIDTGIPLPAVTDDYEGTARPQGNGYDRGALEAAP